MLVDVFVYINEHVITSLFISDLRDFLAVLDNNFQVLEDVFNFLVPFTM